MDIKEIEARRERFRALAGDYASRAKTLLADEDDRSVIYAALELRYALEALIYDLACNYLDELPPAKTLDWQAPKLLERLIEIDPFADKTVYLTVINPATGEQEFRSDARMDWKKLKIRYQKLNSALHAPTIASVEKGKLRNMDNLRADCRSILTVVETVVASNVIMLGGTHHHVFEMNCACGTSIKRRTDPLFVHRADPTKGAASLKIRCWNCPESYQLTLNGDQFEILPNLFGYDCPHDGCGKTNSLWEQEMVAGFETACEHCGGHILMSDALRPVIKQ